MLGASRAFAFDIAAACPGWLYALGIAEGLIASGQAKSVLAIGAEKLSSVTDWNDRGTAVLFGDGAGAAVVQPAAGDGRGILSIVLGADGKLADLLHIPGGGSCDPVSEKVVQERSHYIKMAGREVFKAAVHTMAKACDQALAKAGVSAEEIDLLVPHQANLRIIEATAKHAAVPMSKVMVNVDRYGNTSAASIQFAINQALERRADPARIPPAAGDLRRRVYLGRRGGAMVSILLFPGQGAQRVGMAQDLAEAFPAARETLQAIDAALEQPVTRVMWEGPDERLQQTEHAQPAILAHSAAVLAALGDRLGPVAGAAGHSLGEYSAYVAAGALTPVEGARLVRSRGELMQGRRRRRAPAPWPRCWGSARAEVERVCRETSSGAETVVAANLNTARSDRDLRRPGRGGAGGRSLQGGRGQAGYAPQGERRVPFAAHGARRGRSPRHPRSCPDRRAPVPGGGERDRGAGPERERGPATARHPAHRTGALGGLR